MSCCTVPLTLNIDACFSMDSGRSAVPSAAQPQQRCRWATTGHQAGHQHYGRAQMLTPLSASEFYTLEESFVQMLAGHQAPCLRWRCTRCEIHPNPSGRPSPVKAQHGCMCQSWLVSLGRPRPSVSSRTPMASSRSCTSAQMFSIADLVATK